MSVWHAKLISPVDYDWNMLKTVHETKAQFFTRVATEHDLDLDLGANYYVNCFERCKHEIKELERDVLIAKRIAIDKLHCKKTDLCSDNETYVLWLPPSFHGNWLQYGFIWKTSNISGACVLVTPMSLPEVEPAFDNIKESIAICGVKQPTYPDLELKVFG